MQQLEIYYNANYIDTGRKHGLWKLVYSCNGYHQTRTTCMICLIAFKCFLYVDGYCILHSHCIQCQVKCILPSFETM